MALRDIVIVGIVLVLALWSLRRPWIGVMNWTWLSIMNPHRYAWGFAYNFPVAAIAGVATLVGLVFTPDKQSPFKGRPVWWLLFFALWVTLSWALGVDPSGDYAVWDKVMKVYLMTFVALSLLSTKQQILIFTWVTIGSLAFLAAKGGVFTILTGGSHRVWGPTGSFIEDNNEFALATIIAIPMLHFLQLQLQRPWQRHGMSLLMLLCTAAALGSHSRGALLAIAAMSLVFWWRSSRKGLVGTLILVATIALLPFMPQEWWDRMSTIQTYDQDASAMGRLNAWAVAIGIAKDNFFGAGMSYLYRDFFALYGIIQDVPRAAHSIYFQVLGNHGFIGLIAFLGIWVSTYRLAGTLRKAPRDDDALRWVAQLGGMIQVSLVAYAVGGAFLSLSYFDLPYNLMAITVLTHAWLKQHHAEPARAGTRPITRAPPGYRPSGTYRKTQTATGPTP